MEETVIIKFKPGLEFTGFWPIDNLPDMSPRSNRKPIFGQRSTLIKHMALTSYKLESAIWSRGTSQRITWFDRCQLIITWCHISKKYKTKAACLCQLIIWRLAAILRDSTVVVVVVVVVVHTRPRAIPLAMISTRKSIHWFPLVSYIKSACAWDLENLRLHRQLQIFNEWEDAMFAWNSQAILKIVMDL